jgi:hypothetical protein
MARTETEQEHQKKTAMKNEELIISLIKDDLVNSKLVNGLMDLGLDTSYYFLHLSETILKLMGFNDSTITDDIFNRYLQLTRKAKHINLSDYSHQLDELANEIYTELRSIKPCVHAER